MIKSLVVAVALTIGLAGYAVAQEGVHRHHQHHRHHIQPGLSPYLQQGPSPYLQPGASAYVQPGPSPEAQTRSQVFAGHYEDYNPYNPISYAQNNTGRGGGR